MIYSITGAVRARKEGFVVVDVGGVGYKIFIPARVHEELAGLDKACFFCHLHVREDILDLYGFLHEGDLLFFDKLLTVSGVGPKSALAVMALAPANQLAAAINEGNPDLLMRAAGVGKKIAERIVLELKGKLPALHSETMVRQMESDIDVEEALVGLGYARQQAKKTIAQIDRQTTGLEARLRAALKLIRKA